MPGVIKRLGTRIEGDQIIHDEQPAQWSDADRLAKRRVDRRRNYAIIEGNLCMSLEWTSECSGCTEVGDYGTTYGGGGCRECGYTGKRRNGMWVPYMTPEQLKAMDI